MRKKILSALLLGAFTVATTSTVISCKDYDDEIAALQSKDKTIDSQIAVINTALSDLETAQKQLEAAYKQGDIETLAAANAALENAKKALQDAIDAVNNKVDNLDQRLTAAVVKAQQSADDANKLAGENANAIKKLNDDLTKSVNELNDKIDQKYADALKEIQNLKDAIDGQIAALQATDRDLANADADLLDKLNTLKQQSENMDQALQNNINNLDNKFTDEVKDLKKSVQEVSDKLAEEVNIIKLVLSGDLRSLVFMPYVYVDGIEAIDYPRFTVDSFLTNRTLLSPELTFDRPTRFGETSGVAYAKITIPAGTNFVDETTDNVKPETPYLYVPEVGADYHKNPASAEVEYADLIGFVQRDTRYTETTTRAAGDLIVLAEKNSKNNYQLFNNEAGVLSTGLYCTNFDELKKKENYIVALQSKTSAEGVNITSDYALVYPEEATKLSISWAKKNDRVDLQGNEPSPWDQVCSGVFGKKNINGMWGDFEATDPVHYNHLNQIFDNPYDALIHSASVFVPYNQTVGVDLGDYIQTCFDREGNWGGRQEHVAYKFGDEKKYGFDYEFEIVKYGHVKNLNNGSGAGTGAVIEKDDEYAHMVGSVIIANAQAKYDQPANETAIGREPLVRVLLKHDGKVVRDAFILCRIYAEHVDGDVVVDKYADWTKTYDNCNGLTFNTPTVNPDARADFENIMIKGLLNSEFDFMTFNGIYQLDGGTYTWDNTTNIGNGNVTSITDATIFKSNDDITATPEVWKYTKKDGTTDQIAQIDLTSVKNASGKYYSYVFTIKMTADEVEALTHDRNSANGVYNFYIRWNAINARAPYKHIYTKLTVEINRELEHSGITEKIDNYWYGLDGSKNGWDAQLFNLAYPHNITDASQRPNVWSNKQEIAFVGNEIDFTDASLAGLDYGVANKKFFFVPQNTVITDFEGTEWVITPAYGDNDLKWKELFCEKNVYDLKADNKHSNHEWPLTIDNYYRAANTEVIATNNWTDANQYEEYRALHAQDKSVTDLAALDNIMVWCNTAYNGGVFNNNKLYAVKKADYHNDDQAWLATHAGIDYLQIAYMNQETGEITLDRDERGFAWNGDDNECVDANALDMILNAVGYGANNKYTAQEFHAWVGYVANNGCDVATFTFKNDDSKTHAIWATSWERPINLDNNNALKPGEDYEHVKDAQSNGYYIPVYDLLTFYDWRGKEEGLMEGENKWLWAYYNINRIDVDLNPENVTTDLNNGTLGQTKLSTLSGMVRLYAATKPAPSGIQGATMKRFETLIGWNTGNYASETKNAALLEYLEGTQNGKANFGYIFYENNGLNVTTFKVRIPVTIYYEWGHFKTWVDVMIDTTLGR